MSLTGDRDVDTKIEEWTRWDKNEKTLAEIEELAKDKNVKELRKRLCSRMEFGTAGLRARMGAGYSQMNDLTIIQTTQGFYKYMESICPSLKDHGVVVGYDARHNSRRWAEIVATILVNRGVKVYLYRKISPTPFVPYGVLHFGCDWGIMVTASHNPKEDNGYKVYYANGAQIISPHDKGIAKYILENLTPWESSWKTEVLKGHDLVTDPFDEVMKCYMDDLKGLSFRREKNAVSSVKIVYSAMHGVGYEAIQEAFKAFNFKPVIPVVEQVQPDPEFPTVKFPNPEEGKSALELSCQTADAAGATVILANDPDADRLAIAEKQPNGQWRVLSGNEIGALLGAHIWGHLPPAFSAVPASDVYCLASTVSSKILQTIAKKEGFNFIETLTGFKWMGNVTHDLLQKGKTVIFAFEEAIGFMCGSKVPDKDGVSAAVVAAEMVFEVYDHGRTLSQQLEDIYVKYGHHVSNNSYFVCHEPMVTNALFERLRNWSGPNTYPPLCGPYPIATIRDLTTGYDNTQPDKKAILPTSKSSHMITFGLENGCIMTLRTSGTEPKIKYYTEFVSDPTTGMDRGTATKELQKVVEAMIENFFQPEKNKLTARST